MSDFCDQVYCCGCGDGYHASSYEAGFIDGAKMCQKCYFARFLSNGISDGFDQKWTSEEDEIIKMFYPHMETESLAASLGRNISTVYMRAYELGVRKSPGFHGQNKPIGHKRFMGNGLAQVKVGHNEWEWLHHVKWEEHNGRPVPADHVVLFRDGNRSNLSKENLRLVSREDFMQQLNLSGYPRELRIAMNALNRLKGELNRAHRRSTTSPV